MTRQLSPKGKMISIIAGVAAGLGALLFITIGTQRSMDRVNSSGSSTPAPASDDPADEPPAPDPTPDAGSIKTYVKTPSSSLRKLHTPEARKAMAMAIQSARVRAQRHRDRVAGRAESADTPELEAPPLDKDYIQGVMKQAVPLLAECYELNLDSSPDSAGTLTTTFVIAAEPEAGGYVELADVDVSQMIGANDTLAECVRETVYSLQFEAPPAGGKTTVKYPLKFKRADEDGE